jgi:hypothetical protein
MSLEKLVKDLKGQMSGKWKAHIPAPGHSDDDLSVSLLVTPDNRLVIHTFGGTDWQVVRDNLRERGYITPTGHLTGGGVSQDYNSPDPTRIEKLAAAQRIWDAGRAISETQGEVELRYDDQRLEQFGDRILLTAFGWRGYPDSLWHVTGERMAVALATRADSPFNCATTSGGLQ